LNLIYEVDGNVKGQFHSIAVLQKLCWCNSFVSTWCLRLC